MHLAVCTRLAGIFAARVDDGVWLLESLDGAWEKVIDGTLEPDPHSADELLQQLPDEPYSADALATIAEWRREPHFDVVREAMLLVDALVLDEHLPQEGRIDEDQTFEHPVFQELLQAIAGDLELIGSMGIDRRAVRELQERASRFVRPRR